MHAATDCMNQLAHKYQCDVVLNVGNSVLFFLHASKVSLFLHTYPLGKGDSSAVRNLPTSFMGHAEFFVSRV